MHPLLLCATLLIATFSFAVTPSQAEEKPDPSVVAVFDLSTPITDKPAVEDPLFGTLGAESMQSLTTRLKKAGEDDNVAAVVVLLGSMSPDLAQVEELRQALKSLGEKKPVYAHADSVRTGQYLLLAGAKRVSLSPTGDAWVTGLYGEQLYVRGLLHKLGVEPDFLTCGDYKSAAEMFTRTEASPEAAKMHDWMFDSLYEQVQKMIAASRGVEVEKARKWVDQGLYSAASAKEAGLIDAVETREQLLDHLKQEHGATITLDKSYAKKSGPDIDFENPFSMMQIWAELLSGPKKDHSTKNAVAVVHIDGPIMLGKSEPSLLGSVEAAYSEEIRKALDKIADEPRVRAVVLRVNSPGGSATASEIMLQAVQHVQSRKPVIVSMGNVAASGGYYVSCRGDRIFADATTITGSIGVVAGKLATDAMWRNLGINFDAEERGENAGLMRSGKPWSKDDKDEIQSWMNEVYGVFKDHVTEGRKDKLAKPIDELAGGRVYTGAQALELGLIDEIGTLQDAIRHAAKTAELDDYEIRTFPESKNFIEQLMADIGSKDKNDNKRLSVGIWSSLMPALQGVDPQRVEMLKSALLQLDYLQHEHVMLTLPVFKITGWE